MAVRQLHLFDNRCGDRAGKSQFILAQRERLAEGRTHPFDFFRHLEFSCNLQPQAVGQLRSALGRAAVDDQQRQFAEHSRVPIRRIVQKHGTD